MFNLDSSLDVTRVSSQAMVVAESRLAWARGERSERLPMGVLTRISLPAFDLEVCICGMIIKQIRAYASFSCGKIE